MMVGEKYSDQDVYEKGTLGDIILELKDFSGEGFRNINLAVKKGQYCWTDRPSGCRKQ